VIECHITARAHFVNARDKRGIDLTSHALPFGRLWYEDSRGGLISCDQISMTVPYLKLQ
jgi:hypothetical protein